jgi:uncharacterized protein (TIGR02145 family)
MRTNFKIHCLSLCLVAAAFFIGCKKDEETKPELEYGTVQDAQGNTYKTVKIGEDWWMAENLRSTQFNDNTPLLYVSTADSNAYWAATGEPCFTAIYSGANGMLYNGYVIASEKQIAPAGWHIATDADWKKLETSIGMTSAEANQMGWRGEGLAQEITSLYSAGWAEGVPLFGSNATGFNARPTGCRISDGRTNIFGNTAFWWTTSDTPDGLYYRYIDANFQSIFRQAENIHYGMAIRCVKD